MKKKIYSGIIRFTICIIEMAIILIVCSVAGILISGIVWAIGYDGSAHLLFILMVKAIVFLLAISAISFVIGLIFQYCKDEKS